MKRSVIVTGSLAFDHIMNMPGRFREQILPDKLHIINTSFLVDRLEVNQGGTAGNIAYNLALLDLKPELMVTVGADAKDYLKALRKVGVVTKRVKLIKSEKTSSAFAITDQDDNQIWAFYPGAMKQAYSLSFKVRPLGDSFAVISPNEPKAVVKYIRECVKCGLPYLYDPAFQIANYSKRELEFAIEHAKIVVGNDYEMAQLERKAHKAKRVGQRSQVWITTLGAKGSVVESEGKKFKIPAAKPKNTSDPTGAGDAYRAGFLAGYLRGLSLDVCGRMGSVAAAYTVEKYGTQTHRFTALGFRRRYKENFGEELLPLV